MFWESVISLIIEAFSMSFLRKLNKDMLKIAKYFFCFRGTNLNLSNCKQFQFRRQFDANSSSLLHINKEIGKSRYKMKPFRVSVEGNIGSGKSTLMQYFSKFPFIRTYDEPLEKWRNLEGHNLLELLYQDLTKWNATFQSYVQLTRTQIQSSPPPANVRVQMFERSVQNNRHCFMENAFKEGLLSSPEYHVLKSWYQWIEQNADVSLDLIVYLRSSPDVVYNRIKSRNRPEEKNITQEYLQSVHDAHERWLTDPNLKTPVCVIDADSALSEITDTYEEVVLPLLTHTSPIPLVNAART